MPFQNFLAAARKPNIIPFALLPADYDLTFIENNPGGGTAVVSETPAGTIDGTNATFTLAQTPLLDTASSTATLWLSKNGVLLADGVGFTISGLTITFQAGYIPQVGNVIRATYFR